MDAVFRALAAPARRSLLDELFREDGQTLSALEARLPMTRFGVMKHLKQLEEAGLVVTRRRGRERSGYLVGAGHGVPQTCESTAYGMPHLVAPGRSTRRDCQHE